MKSKLNKIKDTSMANVESALLRAAKKAKQIAKQTNTPLVVLENGQVVEKQPSDMES